MTHMHDELKARSSTGKTGILLLHLCALASYKFAGGGGVGLLRVCGALLHGPDSLPAPRAAYYRTPRHSRQSHCDALRRSVCCSQRTACGESNGILM